MRSKTILYTDFVLVIISYALFKLSAIFYFYWTFWWFDIMIHFLVAFTGALGLYWGIFRSGLIFRREYSMTFVVLTVISCTMLWGIGWEIFEYLTELTDSTEGYVLDTINDLIMDTSGAILAVFIATRKKSKET